MAERAVEVELGMLELKPGLGSRFVVVVRGELESEAEVAAEVVNVIEFEFVGKRYPGLVIGCEVGVADEVATVAVLEVVAELVADIGAEFDADAEVGTGNDSVVDNDTGTEVDTGTGAVAGSDAGGRADAGKDIDADADADVVFADQSKTDMNGTFQGSSTSIVSSTKIRYLSYLVNSLRCSVMN